MARTSIRIFVLSLCLLGAVSAHAGVDVVSACNQAGDDSATDYPAMFPKLAYPTQTMETGTAPEILAALQTYCQGDDGCLAQGPWILLNSSRAEIHNGMYLVQQYLAAQFLSRTGYSPLDVDGVLAQAASREATPFSQATVQQVVNTITAARNDSSNKIAQEYQKLKSYVGGLCVIFLDFGCASALQDEMNIGQVGTLATSIDGNGTTDLTVMGPIQTLFTDSRYVQGLAIAARTLESRVAAAQSGSLPASGSSSDFFSDIQSSYVQAGFDAATATNMAYTFIAYYGARGASVEFTSSLATAENYPILVSAYVISAAIGVLDAYTLSSGHPYSFPPSQATHCNYGRPYHFWLSAFLARQLVLDGHPGRSSEIAAHIAGVGYEMAAGTSTRIPYVSLTLPSNHPSNNSIRMNIAIDDAGAKYGASVGSGDSPDTTDIDDRISQLLGETTSFTPISEAQAEDLYTNHFAQYALDWNSVFHPDDGFLALEL